MDKRIQELCRRVLSGQGDQGYAGGGQSEGLDTAYQVTLVVDVRVALWGKHVVNIPVITIQLGNVTRQRICLSVYPDYIDITGMN